MMGKDKSKNEIVPAAPAGLAAYVTPGPAGTIPAEFAAVSAPDRIPRITLAQGQMAAILEGRAAPGDFLLGQDDGNLGRACDVWVAGWRPKALHVEGDEVVVESYDSEAPEFREIVRRSATDEKVEGTKFYFGPEFLLRTARGWGTFLFSGTARSRGRAAFERLGQGARMSAETRKSARHTWLVPAVAPAEVAAPDPAEVEAAREAFLAPLAARRVDEATF